MGDAELPEDLAERIETLERHLRRLGKIAIGFSGGVDSTFLAAVCGRSMPHDAMLVHLANPMMGSPEMESFRFLSSTGDSALGLPLRTIDLDPLHEPGVRANRSDRCYHCKMAGFTKIIRIAHRLGYPTVVDGSNADDAGDWRPGMRALRELGVRSPLMDLGWGKEQERAVLRAWGIRTWNLPAGACLATRIPCGAPIEPGNLDVVRRCEDTLRDLGFEQVRARLISKFIQIEAGPGDLARLSGGAPGGNAPIDRSVIETLEKVVRPLGFRVRSFAKPYRRGAMNRNDPAAG